MTAPAIGFDTAFQALTDYSPLRWQQRLFGLLRTGQIPLVCDLPTGLGKTSVIPIWTIALALQSQEGSVTLPRRLIYIVNRRTVVDQATNVVEQIRQRLLTPADSCWSQYEATLCLLRGALGGLASTSDGFLTVSTLRGELADNEAWKADPSRPAIVIGTIDKVGSKLLFSGYGDGRYWRAQHAGLVGQDVLIVHDEAHLTPAFSDLLRQCVTIQHQAVEPRPVRLMELSATSRASAGQVFHLEPADEQDTIVRERLGAIKHLRLHELEVGAHEKRNDVVRKVLQKLVDLSLYHQDAQAKVLIYVRSPEDAQQLVDLLTRQLGPGSAERIALLTGTMRGAERDRLIRENPVYAAFADPACRVAQTLYLVSTSAGEVGIDLDADHQVGDATTLDSMIQRLGRVNRRGGQDRQARIDVVVHNLERSDDDHRSAGQQAVLATGTLLRAWAAQSDGVIEVSPRNLRGLLDGLDDVCRQAAFSPKPTVLPLTELLLDAWSLTTIDESMPGRPAVAAYLHGLTDDPPETYVVWRREVSVLDEAGTDPETLRTWFQACRVEARERLRDRTDRVKRMFSELLNQHRRADRTRDFPVVILDERGAASWACLSQLGEKAFDLDYRTVVLPVDAGGLHEQGVLDANQTTAVSDVGDQDQQGQQRERWLQRERADGPRSERLVTGEVRADLPPSLRERERIVLLQPAEDMDGAAGTCSLVLLAQPRQAALDQAETAKTTQTLRFHLDRIGDDMQRISAALQLEPGLADALEIAARWHDRGKDRKVWQRYACNPDPVMALAKSPRYLNWRALGGYRHEFGSLLEAATDERIRAHPEADLILHLIAAHHGWSRPHFEPSAWDRTRTTADNEAAATEVLRRFERLQQRFGRWGLAWLEALVRCADIAASSPDAEPLLLCPTES